MDDLLREPGCRLDFPLKLVKYGQYSPRLSKNPARPHVRSLRPPFSDGLLGPRKKIIQSCGSLSPASALRQGLHIRICAPYRALNLDKNPAQAWDN